MQIGDENVKQQCWKYKNKHGYVFMWCKEFNGKENHASYLEGFEDEGDNCYYRYNYCPYCGSKLVEKNKEM